MNKKIFFIADFNSETNKNTRFIGANKKIRMILSLLLKQGYDVYNINSVPQMGYRQPMRIDEIFFSRNKSIKCLTIPTYTFNKLGRFKNIFDAKEVLQFAVGKFGKPNFVWCYNAYAFQMRFASIAKKMYNCPIILEFEDWHFARSTIFNIKAVLDWYFWKKNIASIDYCYAVNPWIAEIMKKNGIKNSILPGILSKEIIKLPLTTMVSVANKTISSYIDGLNESEKKDLMKFLSTDDSVLKENFETIKGEVIVKLKTLQEGSDIGTLSRITETIEKVESEKYDKLSYFKLKNLKESL